MATSIQERFDKQVQPEPNSGCWLWTGSGTPFGYGLISYGHTHRTWRYAHREFYEHYKGLIPEGFELDHLCRIPSCVNPDHLEAVTHRENVRRGTSIFAQKMNATMCIHGHPFDEKNTHIKRNGSRDCRACNRARAKVNRAKVQ